MIGPSTMPCGTPYSTTGQSEASPSTITLCRRSDRKALIQIYDQWLKLIYHVRAYVQREHREHWFPAVWFHVNKVGSTIFSSRDMFVNTTAQLVTSMHSVSWWPLCHSRLNVAGWLLLCYFPTSSAATHWCSDSNNKPLPNLCSKTRGQDYKEKHKHDSKQIANSAC